MRRLETTAQAREERVEKARQAASSLQGRGVNGIILGSVDNVAITRVKAIPVRRLEDAATWGIGMPKAFDVFSFGDHLTESRFSEGPSGDLRLLPDLSRIVELSGQPGWAWVPTDRYTQSGTIHPACQRNFARRMVQRARQRGLELRCAYEIEWIVAMRGQQELEYPTSGAAFSMTRMIDLTDYLRDCLKALIAEKIEVMQIHPEYAPGQYEVSVGAEDPVFAADTSVLVRQTVRAIAARHGLRVSFAPSVTPNGVGNGFHLHLSVWRDAQNLGHGGQGPHGLTDEGESFLAGVLSELPALLAVGAPGVSSYLRLVPSHWSGAFRCWGLENREAALRVVTGVVGERLTSANAEVKCFDAASNPYLVVGATIAAGLAGIEHGLKLPAEVLDDPAVMPLVQRPPRLPKSLPEALGYFHKSKLLRAAMGDVLFEAFEAVRQAEVEHFVDWPSESITNATRWEY